MLQVSRPSPLTPQAALRPIARTASLITILLGILVLLGWAFSIPTLQSVLPTLVSMKVNTALAFILSGVSLLMLLPETVTPRMLWISHLCAVMVALLALLTLAEYIFGWNFAIDEALFRDTNAVGTPFPGRMGPNTAYNFAAVSLALLLSRVAKPRIQWLARGLALSALLVAFVSLVSYAYGVGTLYGVGSYTQMALHTAMAFVVLVIGIICAGPLPGLVELFRSDTLGGVLARRLLPAAVIIPLVVGWLRLQGQRAGLFDIEFGMALFATANILVFGALVWWNARSLQRTEIKHREAEAETIRLKVDLERRVIERTRELALKNQALTTEIAERKRTEAALQTSQQQYETLWAAAQRQLQERDLLDQVRTLLAREVDLQTIFRTVVETTAQTFGYRYVSLYLSEGDRLVLQHQVGYEHSIDQILITHGISGRVVRTGQAVWLPDVSTDPAFLAAEADIASEVCVPMLVAEQVIGIFNIESTGDLVLSEADLRIALALAQHISIALERARLFADSERLARTDALTGIANRRTLFEMGERELSRARRFGHPLSVLMFDIDHFKQVNDTHGHAVGDQVLEALARCCRTNFRDTDIVARYGGEEFVVLLVETGLTGARKSAERLRDLVAQTATETTQGTIHVTISLGIAEAQPQGDTFVALLGRADQALYAAKQAGRNRVALPTIRST